MNFHTIHLLPRKPSVRKKCDHQNFYLYNNLVVIKEGFCWPACLFSLVWAIFHRLWLIAFILTGFYFLTCFTLYQLGADPRFIFIVGFGISILFGHLANDFWRAKLKKSGYLEKGVYFGPTADAAALRFLTTSAARR